MDATPAQADAKSAAKYPRSIPFIIGNEAAERFSFYGMRSILSTFLVAQFFNPTHNPALQSVAEAKANDQVHFFVALAYFMPLIGGLVADWFFGKYKVILYVSMIYCVGHLFLALFDTDLEWFTYGLLLIAIGAGGIKSCVSANVGDQFDESNQHLMSKIYGWFYFSINSGSVISTMLIPYLYANYGASVAFGVPGILMALATLIFWLGRDRYVKVPPIGLKNALADVQMWKENLGAMGRVLSVFIFIPVFWALWDQNLSEWVLQATKLDLTLVDGFTVLPEQVQTVNPFFLVTMIPIFTYGVYPLLERLGVKVTPLRKMGAGFLLAGISFVIIAQLQERIDAGQHPTVWWQILAYLVLSASEVLVSVTSLEYAYTHSPKAIKSLMSSFYLLVISAGNLFVSFVNQSIANKGFFSRFEGASYYWFFVGLMAVNFVLYLIATAFIKEKIYVGQLEEVGHLPE
ncbi:POT family MFS transporter [Spirosoma aerolatum]|uniref:POT family MFS transporter n=1 Tax=Spirosoma aerolatum TaxID=1211326 RepID=UPI0009AEA22B|nr:POT family MFS transporter [Spirosoma aerolatum]